jgi:uncharacterized protein involved in response to NO
MTPVPRLRPYAGPALLSYGFRPFFLLGSIFAGCAILAWLPMFYGELKVSTAFVPRDWHVHEMIFGYAAAVVTGFLLTAVPNWTGRLPVQGGSLTVLLALWVAGRIAVLLSASIGWTVAAVIDLAFLAGVAAVVAREIIAGRNWGNLKVLVVIGVLMAGNVVFHLEAHFRGVADYGIRLGIAAILMLITIVGGRIIPSFTRNWLARQNPGRLPAPFGRFDVATLAVGALALVMWIALPFAAVTGMLLLAAGLAHAVRLARWAGDRTLRDRLVLVLHAGYAFVPIGFLLEGLGALGIVAPSAGIHAWTVGAVGTMTLAVMTRASLGHTGRELKASWPTQAIYALIVISAVARIAAALLPVSVDLLLHVAACGWAGAFLGFALAFGPLLMAPRAVQKVVPA